jgi:hypothetical protein
MALLTWKAAQQCGLCQLPNAPDLHQPVSPSHQQQQRSRRLLVLHQHIVLITAPFVIIFAASAIF